MLLAHERQFPEGLARADDREECGVAQPRSQARGEPAARDEVERVGGIALVEHDLPARERPPAGDRQHRFELLRRDVREQVPVHGSEDTPARCAGPGERLRAGICLRYGALSDWEGRVPQALVVQEFGGPEAPVLEDRPELVPGPGEAVIDLRACCAQPARSARDRGRLAGRVRAGRPRLGWRGRRALARRRRERPGCGRRGHHPPGDRLGR